jgi:hypothetical protein
LMEGGTYDTHSDGTQQVAGSDSQGALPDLREIGLV